MKIKKVNELYQKPDDMPYDLDQDKLWPGDGSHPIERVRNLLNPYFSYFQILELERDNPKMKNTLEKLEIQCIENLPYLFYWLKKLG